MTVLRLSSVSGLANAAALVALFNAGLRLDRQRLVPVTGLALAAQTVRSA